MSTQSPLERGVAFALFLLLVAGAAVSIAFDRDAPQPTPVTTVDEP